MLILVIAALVVSDVRSLFIQTFLILKVTFFQIAPNSALHFLRSSATNLPCFKQTAKLQIRWKNVTVFTKVFLFFVEG